MENRDWIGTAQKKESGKFLNSPVVVTHKDKII
jgi:hypothetical protein